MDKQGNHAKGWTVYTKVHRKKCTWISCIGWKFTIKCTTAIKKINIITCMFTAALYTKKDPICLFAYFLSFRHGIKIESFCFFRILLKLKILLLWQHWQIIGRTMIVARQLMNAVQPSIFPSSSGASNMWTASVSIPGGRGDIRESTCIHWNTVNKCSPRLTWSIGRTNQRMTWPLWSYCWGNIQH